ncbi:MAG: indole-3-glycerol phosphate synthase TrpC [Myxococcales bacterium]|nr:indole-3-glycerol phosphate synthase TrpC [Myxococcales bacterium]
MTELLHTFAERSRERAAKLDLQDLRARLADRPAPPPLQRDTFDVIAEFKRASPSKGPLNARADGLEDAVARYTEAGAAAISVLTEPTAFGGSLSDLTRAAACTDRPVLRKDFIVDDRQLLEARLAGAGGVLLMAALCDADTLTRQLSLARELGLFVLAEAHDAAQLDRIHAALDRADRGTVLVGVNVRNFATLGLERKRLWTLRPLHRDDEIYVAESGMHQAADIGVARAAGYRMALVGTALMQAADPARLLGEMLAAGRQP